MAVMRTGTLICLNAQGVELLLVHQSTSVIESAARMAFVLRNDVKVRNIVPFDSNAQKANAEQKDLKEVHENAQLIGGGDGSTKGNNSAAKKGEPEIGRNDPCPCGSGKKYKKCHGIGK